MEHSTIGPDANAPVERSETEAPAEAKRAAVPAWLISAVTHGAILSVFSLVVLLTTPDGDDVPPLKTLYLAPLPVPEVHNNTPLSEHNEVTIPIEQDALEGPTSPLTELDID